MCRRAVLTLALTLLAAPLPLRAADHPIGGDTLTLRDPAGKPQSRVVRFNATKDPQISLQTAADPRLVGAAIQFAGAGGGDGDSTIINLPAGFWTGIGNPPGSKGYKYQDKNAGGGIKKVMFRGGNQGGALQISGGKNNWLYQITQAQSAIDVRFTLGADVYCATFTGANFTKNEPGKVNGKKAPPPPTCTPSVCGNGVAEYPEECDDGGTTPGDGCDAACVLENTSALCAGVASTSGTALAAVRVASGLERPVQVTAPRLDPSRVFIVLQNGRIRILKNGVLLATPFLSITSNITTSGEQGLLGLAFHPNYESNGLFFVNYTNGAGDTVIARYSVSGNPDVANPTGTPILTIDQDFSNHNGGQIHFGPNDGYLYIGMGDGGSGGDPNERAQDDGELLGKMLRIDVNTPPYTIPPSNPHVGPGEPLDEIWQKGLRNPWRFAFDRLNGDMYIADVGQGEWEEIDYVPASSTGGEDFGWDIFEGTHCYEPTPPAVDCPAPPTGYTMPVHEYCHFQSDPGCDENERGCSVSGGSVYRGCAMPDLHGTYFYSDYCSSWIKTLKVVGGMVTATGDVTNDLDPPNGSIDGVTSIGEDARGELYITDHGSAGSANGEVWKIVPE